MKDKDNIFTDEELQVIGKFFTIMLRAVKRESSPKIHPEAKKDEPEQVSPFRDRLIPLSKWNKYHDWPTTAGLRHLVFFAATNSFDKVLTRVGRRVLIDEKAFFEWFRLILRQRL